MNPVVLLDEIDKVGADYRGDPAAALLEVLDPAQNHTFRDHYLELDLDLSDVLFLATANVLDTIPPALLDRMELVTHRRLHRGRQGRHRARLPAAAAARAGRAATTDEVTVTDEALRELAANYTREAGVRQLERLLAKVFRKVATRLADRATRVVGRRGGPDGPGRPAAVHPRVGGAHGGARRRHRARGDRDGRRRAVHRGDGAAGRASRGSRSPASSAT